MPRDHTFDDEERRDRRDREDFGLADYSDDYGYDPRERRGYRTEERLARDDDYGQADYSRDWTYDRGEAGRREVRDEGRRDESRSWLDRAGDALAGHDAHPQPRRGPSDRVLWAVIVQRLKDERGLDLRDVEVLVDGAEVTLNGTVRRKDDKRRIEDVADVDGVRHVQNNLRVRDRGRWTFF